MNNIENEDDAHREVSDPEEIQQLLEELKRSSTTNLYLENAGQAAWPVKVISVHANQGLTFDIGKADEMMPLLEAGASCWLVGDTSNTMIRTPAMQLLEEQPTRRQQIACNYPDMVHSTPRRGAFRAVTTNSMNVRIQLAAQCRSATIKGRLDNLSMGGCLLILPLADSAALCDENRITKLTIRFPNGKRLNARGHIRHVNPDNSWQEGRVGYEFAEDSPDFKRQLTYYVHEIERQRAHEITRDDFAHPPSPLFDSDTSTLQAKRQRPARPSQITKDITTISAWLDAQLIQVRAGGPVATRPLLNHGRKLLKWLRHDREALLFAISGLDTHPTPVKHGMGVAIRLADLLEWKSIHDQPLDAIISCALIHDFGKVLLPHAIRYATRPYSGAQRAELATHVRLLTERLHDHEHLPPDVIAAVIGQANERLDGSGYPDGRGADDLPQLARMMAVVDVADAMQRDRADRSARPLKAVYQHLLQAGEQLDNGWVQRYIRRFGMTPIGSLARFADGTLAWIQRLDANSKPVQVKIVSAPSSNEYAAGATVDEKELATLGTLEGLADPREYDF